LPDFKDMQHLSFREELYAIEAVNVGSAMSVIGPGNLRLRQIASQRAGTMCHELESPPIERAH
jgi:hypothetical protein